MKRRYESLVSRLYTLYRVNKMYLLYGLIQVKKFIFDLELINNIKHGKVNMTKKHVKSRNRKCHQF